MLKLNESKLVSLNEMIIYYQTDLISKIQEAQWISQIS